MRVDNSAAVTIVLGAGTDYADKYPAYRGEDPHKGVTKVVDAATEKGYEALRTAHVADDRGLFDRFSLDPGQRLPDAARSSPAPTR